MIDPVDFQMTNQAQQLTSSTAQNRKQKQQLLDCTRNPPVSKLSREPGKLGHDDKAAITVKRRSITQTQPAYPSTLYAFSQIRSI